MPRYTIALEAITATVIRSAGTDTIVAGFSLVVGNQSFGPITDHVGDVAKGDTVTTSLAFHDVEIATPDTPVALNYIIVNAGNFDGNIDQAISGALDAVGGALIGAGIDASSVGVGIALAGAGVAVELLNLGWSLVDANCDGTVAGGTPILFPRSAIDDVLSNGSGVDQDRPFVFVASNDWAGTDSPKGCGANSQYKVLVSIVPSVVLAYPAVVSKWPGDIDLLCSSQIPKQLYAASTNIFQNEPSYNGYFTVIGSELFTDHPFVPTVVSRSPGFLDAFFEDQGSVTTVAFAPGDGGFSAPSPVPNAPPLLDYKAKLTAISRNTDLLDVFYLWGGGRMVTSSWDPVNGWAPARDVGDSANYISPPYDASTLSAPYAISRLPDVIDLFAVGNDGALYWNALSPDQDWGSWQQIVPPGNVGGVQWEDNREVPPIAAVSRRPGFLDVFFVGDPNLPSSTQVWTMAFEPDKGWFGLRPILGDLNSPDDPFLVGLSLVQSPSLTTPFALEIAAVSRSIDKLDVFAVGFDGRLWTAAWEDDGYDWHGWRAITNQAFPTAKNPAVVSAAPDRLDVFIVGPDGAIYTSSWQPSQDGWTDWKEVATAPLTIVG